MNLRNLQLLSLLAVASVFLATCACAEENETASYGIMDAASELGLSSFSSALEDAGIADTLNNEGVLLFNEGSFLVFAPSDEAFSDLDEIVSSSIMENQTELKRVLGYHVVWNEDQFDNLSEVASLETLQGENLTINATDGLKVNGAAILESKEYDSGVVYVIDKVLMPEGKGSMGVIEAANEMGNLKKFATAVKTAGIAERLNGQGLLGIGALAEGPFTVFAPNDAAFDQAPKATMDAITKQQDGMRQLLSYHVVEAQALNRTDANSVKTLMGDSLAIDPSMGLAGGAKVLSSKRYDNGIIYEIDQVLIPLRLSMGT